MKKIINPLVLLFVIFIAACSSAGSSSSSSGGSGGTPIEIGSLPNGSTVYISQNDLPITDGTPAQTEIYLEGGSPNESYNIVFATNQQLQSKLQTNSSDNYGINVTTAPTPCIIGTAGSGASSKCQITIASSVNTYPGTYLITPTATPVNGSGTATTLSPLTILVSGSIKPSTKAITSFSLNGTAGVITGQNIAVTMPYGTNVTALVATYITTGQSVTVGSVTQSNGVTTNNFGSPVTYTVHAEDGSTQNYTVTVTVATNSAKAITDFSLDGTTGVISGQNIAVAMPYGTSVTTLVATYVTTGQSVTVGSVTQSNGVTTNNFGSPVTYTVHAEDGSTQSYTVVVTVAQNSAKAITAFSLGGTAGVISGQNISVTMPYGTNVMALIATFTTTGQSVTVGVTSQVSGVTPNDFTNSVTYTVTAADGSTQNYRVMVTVAQNSAKAITAFSLGGTAGIISGQNISVTMPYGTNVMTLIATFTTTGQSVTVGATSQVSGVTPNNFANSVIYVVTAEDGSTQNYRVTVTVAQNSAKAITAFSLGGTAGVISGQNISVTMPYGTNVMALIATFTTTGQSVTVGATSQVSGVTPNDFTNSVTYTVTAADGSTQDYTVTVTVALNSDNHMIEFSIGGTIGVIDQNNNTIAVAMPYGTSDVSSLTASYITDGESVTVASVEQVNGVTPNNFTNPVTYVVHAANGDTRNYVVTVTIKPVISQATAISFAGNYAFLTSNVSSDITMCSVTNESQLTACRNISESNLSLPQGASSISAFESSGGITLFITANEIPPTPPSIFQCLIPTGGASTCSKINPAPGLQSNRLLSTAALNPESSAKITSFAIGGVSGLINNNNIYVTLPYGANLNGLAATFTNTGKSVKVNNLVQVSGVTTNNFTNNVPLQYIVTAKNNTANTYNVYVRWSIFSGVIINPYAPSAINAPLVYSTLESEIINISVGMDSGLYSAAHYGIINSFPAGMNANGLSSIALAKLSGVESYNYVMTNIAESMVYACKVNQSASGFVSCRPSAVPQPSSLVETASATTALTYVSSYSQNILVGCMVLNNNFACDLDPDNIINPPGIFNLPRSLSVNSDRTWLFALNEGDNSYAACQINTGGSVNPTTCRKTYFSSL